jgi:pimeloyl-ACP methyl ester carboxylesterase
MLGLMSRLSPRSTARQTLAIFSNHDPDDSLSRLSAQDIDIIRRFFQGRSSRQGALNDGTHVVGRALLQTVQQPTLVVHSREDRAVPFSHAEWALENIPHAQLYEAGFTGHFFWVGPDFPGISQRLIEFLELEAHGMN